MGRQQGSHGPSLLEQAGALVTDEEFNEAALAQYARQVASNAPYRAYCERLGRAPGAVRHWSKIPGVPTDAFKAGSLATFDPADAERVFMTSGTSAGPESRGKVYKDRSAMAVHDAVVRDGFRRWCLPDRERIRLFVLAPPEDSAPNLRMAHDCSLFLREFDNGEGRHFIGVSGLDVAALIAALHVAEAQGEPVMLVGATFSLVRFFDACAEQETRFKLPPGSRMADGGGYKGRSRELTKAAFLATAAGTLGVPQEYCVNLLGITELSSLFFDNVLAGAIHGDAPARRKMNAPWTRTRAVAPDTLELLPTGEEGLLRHWDLANVASVIALQTDDLGVCFPDEGDSGAPNGGFEVLGRARGAELRGCSLAMEQFLDARAAPFS
jgi:Acyl-protein synthetase, LuxE